MPASQLLKMLVVRTNPWSYCETEEPYTGRCKMQYRVHLTKNGDMGDPIEVPDAENMFKTLAVGDVVRLGSVGYSTEVVYKVYSNDWGPTGEFGVLVIRNKTFEFDLPK
ncbi:hypothetical protein [Pseudomonas soli]|uniref:hypothetical protein n=1 Tax=Pseudomonas soli TaxID=1306993 RepID=UPI003818F204